MQDIETDLKDNLTFDAAESVDYRHRNVSDNSIKI